MPLLNITKNKRRTTWFIAPKTNILQNQYQPKLDIEQTPQTNWAYSYKWSYNPYINGLIISG